ncbi:serine hydrolase, partial [bacterium]|nr:serine hydrolase [bacterium]
LLAGNDVLLMPDDLDESTKSIKNAIKDGTITEKRLKYSVKKILMAKYKAGLHKNNKVDLKNIVEDMNSNIDKSLFEEITEKSITLIKNDNDILPLKDVSSKIAFLEMGDSNSDEFFKMLNHYTKVDKVEYDSKAELLRTLKPYKTVIVGFHKSNKSPFDPYKFSKTEIETLELLSKNKNVILNVFAKAYALMDVDITNVSSVLVSYQNNVTAQNKSAQIIFGALPAVGKLPVSINKKYPLHTSIKTETINRLSYGLPSSKNFDLDKLNSIDLVIEDAIEKRMTPGAQLLIAKNGKVVLNKSYGYKTYEKNNLINWDHIYDLASLTKILSSVPLLMNEYESNDINEKSTLSDILPDLDLKDKGSLLLKEMLAHQSGLYPWIPFYKETLDSVSYNPLTSFYSKKKTKNILFQ